MKKPRATALVVGSVLLALSPAAPAWAQRADKLPGDLEEVGVDQNLDAQVPADLAFVDSEGQPVTLGRYLDAGRPVLLTLVYYDCPMLCTLVLDGMVDTLKEIDWTPGDQFEIVTVSIDPRETPELAREKKRRYVEVLDAPGAERGWHFLTGDQEAITTLAETVGFRYTWLEDRGEFAHPAVLFILTPDGRISRYLFGIRHDPRTLRWSLVEASEGTIGSPVDKFLLYCYQYDAEEGRYSPVAMQIMQVAGVITVLVLGGVLLLFWRREARLKKRQAT